MTRAGFVLVGGNSSRMGRDKALLACGGQSLLGRIAAEVAAAAGSATLVGPPEKYGGRGYPVIPDERAGLGPIGGIQAALKAGRADWNLVVACDMPALKADFLGRLLEAAERCGADCLVPLSGAGRLEPLCAAYHQRALAGFNGAIQRGVRKLTEALQDLRMAQWPAAEAPCFENLNTPEDWARHSHA